MIIMCNYHSINVIYLSEPTAIPSPSPALDGPKHLLHLTSGDLRIPSEPHTSATIVTIGCFWDALSLSHTRSSFFKKSSFSTFVLAVLSWILNQEHLVQKTSKHHQKHAATGQKSVIWAVWAPLPPSEALWGHPYPQVIPSVPQPDQPDQPASTRMYQVYHRSCRKKSSFVMFSLSLATCSSCPKTFHKGHSPQIAALQQAAS